MGRDVAIKVLTADRGGEPGFRERFSREALIAALLTNPHIIPIYDTGEIDGQLYLVMPIINGIDLEAALKRDGPMSPTRAVRVVEQIAAALDAAHTQGLVHRDVKPSNALMTAQGFVYLIDFGLAQDGTGAKLTAEGRTAGTWAYMAPERMMSDDIDARADVYSLACLLYECLTGEMPFPGDRVALQMTAHLSTPPPKPSERQSAVPEGFDDVVARGMAKDRDERYPSAGDLAVALSDALATPHCRDSKTSGAPASGPRRSPGHRRHKDRAAACRATDQAIRPSANGLDAIQQRHHRSRAAFDGRQAPAVARRGTGPWPRAATTPPSRYGT